MNAATRAAPVRDRRQDLLAALAAILPPDSLLSQPEQTVPFECDGLAAFRQPPFAVVLPATEDQVRAVLRVCHDLQVPLVARGAGTGLSGGAMPCANGIVLSRAKLNRIIEIDPRA